MGGHLNLGNRVDPSAYHNQESVLGNSLLAQQANGKPPPYGHQFPPLHDTDSSLPPPMHGQPFDTPQLLDPMYASHPESKYGSPRDDNRLPMSPIMHLSTLDAPLPASFDSQGISYMARHGPVAASVPSKFGLDSPPSSLPKKSLLPSDALRHLQDSAFGRDARAKPSHLSSSPAGPAEEASGQRIMHSQRISKPKMMSASLPRGPTSDDWEDDILFGGEEDYLPSNLTHLLNAEEKTRRFSGREHDPSGVRENLSGLGTPAEVPSKFGSPSTASPSRFSALFTKQKREEEVNGLTPSTFGHVGSPLRNSSFHLSSSPGPRNSSRPAGSDFPSHLSSPPRQGPMSMLSQQLQRTLLSDSPSSLHPVGMRQVSNSSSKLDRAVSSSSINASRIVEEQGDCVFSLDEEEYNESKQAKNGNLSTGRKSPNLGPVGGGRLISSPQNLSSLNQAGRPNSRTSTLEASPDPSNVGERRRC